MAPAGAVVGPGIRGCKKRARDRRGSPPASLPNRAVYVTNPVFACFLWAACPRAAENCSRGKLRRAALATREIVWRLDENLDRGFSCIDFDGDFGVREIDVPCLPLFGRNLPDLQPGCRRARRAGQVVKAPQLARALARWICTFPQSWPPGLPRSCHSRPASG